MSKFEIAAQIINDAEFGTPFTITPEGDVTVADMYAAPEDVEWSSEDEFLETGAWNAVEGLTNQHGYNGPIMHASEVFSAGCLNSIMRDRNTPVTVVLATVTDIDDEYSEPFGWVVLTSKK